MIKLLGREAGFTLIELVIVIIVIAVLASVATVRMQESLSTAKYEQTKQEMQQIIYAIAGNPELQSNGARTNFGYIGDIGAFPVSLDNLVTNPGGYTTWNGPYIESEFTTDAFKRDGWNTLYTFSGNLLRSTGSGSNIDKLVAPATADLLSNSITGIIVDADGDMPGGLYVDSFSVRLTYPNGSGSLTTTAVLPNKNGKFSFSSIPIGNHTLEVIYIPDSDTISHMVSIYPARDVKLDITFPADLW